MGDRQGQQSGQGSSNDEEKGYFDRIRAETRALNRLLQVESSLSSDLKTLGTQLLQLKGEPESEERDQNIETCIQKITDRMDSFQEQIDAYKALDTRGPWSLNADVQRAVDKQSSDLESLKKLWTTFFGSHNED